MVYLWLLFLSISLCAADRNVPSAGQKIVIGSPVEQHFVLEDTNGQYDVLGEKYRDIIHNRVIPISEHASDIEIDIDFSEYNPEPCNNIAERYQSFPQFDVVPRNTPVTPTFLELLCCCFFENIREDGGGGL
ncbi:hypothetical protein KBD08_02685 [Candidatus Babeliales bacterium]|nr:hypothetical protein [Candidatus Babeliales bacterium]